MRIAGGEFWGPCNIRSQIFESLAEEYSRLTSQITQTRDSLVKRLYDAVPLASPPARRILLQIKRKISNFGLVSDEELEALAPDLRACASEYCRNLCTREAMLESKRQGIFQELRQQLQAVIADELFSQAVDYSCPWLIDTYRRHDPGDLTEFSNEERGVYSYAVRCFSKANPFHAFASVAFPSHSGIAADCDCELTINAALILQLERRLLAASDRYARRIYLRSYLATADAYEFFVTGYSSVRRMGITKNPAIQCIIEYFRAMRSRYTFGDCIEYIAGELPGVDRTAIEKSILQLIDHGIMVEYLVTDFDHFAKDLLGIDADCDALIHSLQKFHLARVPGSSLAGNEQQLKGALGADFKFEGTPYYVHAYSRESTGAYEEAAARLHPALQAIKPLLLPFNNFAKWTWVNSAFIHERCATAPDGVPYLALLTDFLSDLTNTVSRYQASVSEPRHKALAEWRKRLSACTGELSDEQLVELLAMQPVHQETIDAICFNGPVDAKRGIFYPQNLFAGDGRYLCRYLMSTPRRPGSHPQEVLDVQLVCPYEDNRHYVAPVFSAACGFDSRYRHKFADWIDPAGVTVKSQDGRIVYEEKTSGRPLRFRFFGFFLAPILGPEYQLLLATHADFFYNPFEWGASPGEMVQHVPSLCYKSVCLRIEQWRFHKAFFEPAWKVDDILRSTLTLLAMLQDAGIDFTKCYFEFFDPPALRKPRYLDFANPLSVHAFRRAVRSCSDAAVVSLARMEPEPADLFQHNQRPHVTELMIEA